MNRKKSNNTDYSEITEKPGLGATAEQIARLYHRYHFARQFAKDKDVLEVACGAGLGLGYLAKIANRVVGGDIEEKNVSIAKKYYEKRENIEIKLIDAHILPFTDKSFDLVLLYEAIYYFKEPQKFVSEAKRVLRENGILIICTVNKDWEDFHPSIYSCKYFSIPELYELLKDDFKNIHFFGAFPTNTTGLRDIFISFLKRTAVKLNLIPGSLNTRAYLKRIFIGKLTSLANEVHDGMTSFEEPIPIEFDKVNKNFKIIYTMARK
ncbi:MAG TPA: hypothetical protein DHV62_00470 [Elusimicrobia bacterium]|jgi:ubiquinone/menaquinone biosynthesis C-methylase UbiE|nr:hypothetical protein [Elusimicrobiota bacterium]